MRAGGAPRWALSFADLCLLLLGFTLILAARPNPAALTQGIHAALGARPAVVPPHAAAPAAALFDVGEAVLSARGLAWVAAFARAAGDRPVALASHGTDAGGARFDDWELAAARTASIARALAADGVPEGHIALSLGGAPGGGQRIMLTAS